MTPYDHIFKIIHKFKGYHLTSKETIKALTEIYLSYPGFSKEAQADFLKYLDEDSSKKPMDTSQIPAGKEFPKDLNPADL
jgi:hypothetical protein